MNLTIMCAVFLLQSLAAMAMLMIEGAKATKPAYVPAYSNNVLVIRAAMYEARTREIMASLEDMRESK